MGPDWNGDGKYDWTDEAFYHEVVKGDEKSSGNSKKNAKKDYGSYSLFETTNYQRKWREEQKTDKQKIEENVTLALIIAFLGLIAIIVEILHSCS